MEIAKLLSEDEEEEPLVGLGASNATVSSTDDTPASSDIVTEVRPSEEDSSPSLETSSSRPWPR